MGYLGACECGCPVDRHWGPVTSKGPCRRCIGCRAYKTALPHVRGPKREDGKGG